MLITNSERRRSRRLAGLGPELTDALKPTRRTRRSQSTGGSTGVVTPTNSSAGTVCGSLDSAGASTGPVALLAATTPSRSVETQTAPVTAYVQNYRGDIYCENALFRGGVQDHNDVERIYVVNFT